MNNLVRIENTIGFDKTISELTLAEDKGTLNILYDSYQKKTKSGNFIVPYLDDPKKDVIVVNNPDDAEEIASKNIKKMPNLNKYLLDGVLSTTDTDLWIKQKQEFVASFSVNQHLQHLIPLSLYNSSHFSKSLVKETNYFTQSININELLLQETMSQLLIVLFGFTKDFEKNYNKKIREGITNLDKKTILEYYKEFNKQLDLSDSALACSFKDINQETGFKTKLGNVITFTFAGHDTTAHTLSWLIYELSKNIKVQDTLRDEILMFWKNNPDPSQITYNRLKSLKYMSRCIQETLRLWPALSNGTYRELTKDDYITGESGEPLKLVKGSYVHIPNWSRHRSTKLWGEDAELFNPMRDFLDDEYWDNEGIASYNTNSHRFSPFTYGPRDCLGKNFSHIEMRLILLHILRDYIFELSEDQENMKNPVFINKFTLAPRDIYDLNKPGLYVNLKRYVPSKL